MEELDDNSISKFPEPVIQHVVSFLPPGAAAQTAVLSKSWLNAWITSPIVRFKEPRIVLSQDRDDFLDSVNKMLRGYTIHNHGIQTFELSMKLVEYANDTTDQLVDEWINVVAGNASLRKLHLSLSQLPADLKVLELPRKVYEAKSLEYLSLEGFIISKNVPICPLTTLFRCNNLQHLVLKHDNLSDETFVNIISNCQGIEHLEIEECRELRNININNLKSLKVFSVSISDLGSVEAHGAPNLECFTCIAKHKPCRLNLFDDRNPLTMMKHLHLSGVEIPDTFLSNLINKYLPHLEDLNISYFFLQRVKIYSQSLKTIELLSPDIKELQVDAPKIVRFVYLGPCISSVLFTSRTTPSESQVVLRSLVRIGIDNSWFFNLRQMLTNLRETRVFLTINTLGPVTFTPPAGDNDNDPDHPVPQIESLSLELENHPTLQPDDCSAIVDGCFWSCRPKVIKQGWWKEESAGRQRGTAQFTTSLYEMLFLKKSYKSPDPDHLNLMEIYHERTNKFWEKDLKDNFKVDIFVQKSLETDYVQQPEFSGLESILKVFYDSYTCGPCASILVNFNLEWHATKGKHTIHVSKEENGT